MNSFFQKIIAFIVVILVVAGGLLIYKQSAAIDKLSARLNSESNGKTPDTVGNAQNIAKDPANMSSLTDQQKEKFESSVKFIEGKVASVSGNTLTVEGDVPDWKKMEEIAASPELSQQYKSKMAPTIKKNYNVSTTGETKFSGDQLSEIKAGETVMVYAKEFVSQTDNLTAVEVVAPYKPALPPGIQQ